MMKIELGRPIRCTLHSGEAYTGTVTWQTDDVLLMRCDWGDFRRTIYRDQLAHAEYVPALDNMDGFVYDQGDWSVGIGSEWTHANCPLDLDDYRGCTEEMRERGVRGAGVNRFRELEYTITCRDCGESVVFDEDEWDPDDEH